MLFICIVYLYVILYETDYIRKIRFSSSVQYTPETKPVSLSLVILERKDLARGKYMA